MTQVTSLHSPSFLNPFIILPPEILANILRYMRGCAIYNARNLSVSEDMRIRVLSSVKYVGELITNKITMIQIFTGVRYLSIVDDIYTSVRHLSTTDGILPSFFSKNTCNNLVSLSIPFRMLSCLTEYPMLNLRCLDITSGCECDVDYTESYLNPKLLPALRVFRTVGHWIINIGDIQTLENVEILYAEIDVKVLNKLNISELSLTAVYYRDVWDITKFNIPSLRKLTVNDEYFDLSRLDDLNIVELILKNIDSNDDENFTVNIQSLETLVLDSPTCDMDISKLSKLKTLSVHAWIVEKYKVPYLTTLNIIGSRYPYNRNQPQLNIDKVMINFPEIKNLNIQNEYCKISGHVPDDLIISYQILG